MKIFAKIVLVLFLCGWSAGAWAQSEATQDADAWFKKADAELNQVYKTVLAKISDPQQKQELEKAQKAWVAFRDADAQFRAGVSSGGGSSYTTDMLGNMAEMTDARTKDLKALLGRLSPR